MPNHNPGSPRMTFQWKYVDDYYAQHPIPTGTPPKILNIGCADDPLRFGELVHHYDIDNWSAKHKWFTQGDAHELPFDDESFDIVVMGDIHEHLTDPWVATQEAARVVAQGGLLVMTIFEEWRLPGRGQWIDEGQALANQTVNAMGYDDYEAHQLVIAPERKGTPESLEPHLVHINQFADSDIKVLIGGIASEFDMEIVEFVKAYEATHEGHAWYNWLVCLQRRIE